MDLWAFQTSHFSDPVALQGYGAIYLGRQNSRPEVTSRFKPAAFYPYSGKAGWTRLLLPPALSTDSKIHSSLHVKSQKQDIYLEVDVAQYCECDLVMMHQTSRVAHEQ